MHSEKRIAWIATSKHGIIKLYYGIAVTVTKERYVPVLEHFWGELIKCEHLDKKE